ncbi:TrbC/VirB2 family protein [Legionella pneumophila]|jgi:type IV secretion system protein TrbC|uniref:TrbC/VirB2 family protein n=1 Tax=Legionella pneumophila TaxID=446 RepID=UPI0002C10D92|nr:TrbC/VirB2 family protein [Legionella pneumophila]AGH55381.1 putative conjugal transfer protein trbC [Legionella pneumophila subsp. pneumophila LPE509]MCW8442367.1 TrbC/VirB2 family protein [Legionella pneumophila]
MNNHALIFKPQMLIALGLMIVLLLGTEPSFASSTSGGGLPFDTWLTKISNSITGPFAFSVSIIGLVAAGAALIFGGDMNGFMRTLIFIVLVLAFIIAAKNTLSAITGKGAQIGTHSVHSKGVTL